MEKVVTRWLITQDRELESLPHCMITALVMAGTTWKCSESNATECELLVLDLTEVIPLFNNNFTIYYIPSVHKNINIVM